MKRPKKQTIMLLFALMQSSYADNDSSNLASADELFLLAVEKNKMGILIEASVLLTQAIAIDAKQHRFYHQRGLSFIGMDQIDRGIKDFKQAVDLKSDVLNVYLKLISHYMSESQYMLVLIITDQLIVNIPEQAVGTYDHGKAYESMNKPHLAIAAYQKVIKMLDPGMSDFRKQLTARVMNIRINMEKKS